jgi:hypothetical protein
LSMRLCPSVSLRNSLTRLSDDPRFSFQFVRSLSPNKQRLNTCVCWSILNLHWIRLDCLDWIHVCCKLYSLLNSTTDTF